MASTDRCTLRVVAIVVLGFGGSACATRLPPMTVSPDEASSLLASLPHRTKTDIEIDADRRYFDIFLSDSVVASQLGEEQREAIASTPRPELIDGLRGATAREWGANAASLTRVSPSQLRSLVSQAPERGEDLQRAADAIEEIQGPIVRRIQAVGGQVLAAGGRSDIAIVVDASVGLNAMVPTEFGSNRMFVGPELALHTGSDDELACVMGHELAHITEGHTTSGAWANVGKATLTVLVATALIAAAAQGNQGAPLSQSQLDGALALGQLTTFAVAEVPLRLSGWERGQEREADAMGLWYAKQAGYDPDACAGFMLRMTQIEASEGAAEEPRWWAIHPPTAERVVALRKLAVEVEAGRLRPNE